MSDVIMCFQCVTNFSIVNLICFEINNFTSLKTHKLICSIWLCIFCAQLSLLKLFIFKIFLDRSFFLVQMTVWCRGVQTKLGFKRLLTLLSSLEKSYLSKMALSFFIGQKVHTVWEWPYVKIVPAPINILKKSRRINHAILPW